MGVSNKEIEQLTETFLRIIEDEGWEIDGEIEWQAHQLAKFVITQNEIIDEEESSDLEELNFDEHGTTISHNFEEDIE